MKVWRYEDESEHENKRQHENRAYKYLEQVCLSNSYIQKHKKLNIMVNLKDPSLNSESREYTKYFNAYNNLSIICIV